MNMFACLYAWVIHLLCACISIVYSLYSHSDTWMTLGVCNCFVLFVFNCLCLNLGDLWWQCNMESVHDLFICHCAFSHVFKMSLMLHLPLSFLCAVLCFALHGVTYSLWSYSFILSEGVIIFNIPFLSPCVCLCWTDFLQGLHCTSVKVRVIIFVVESFTWQF